MPPTRLVPLWYVRAAVANCPVSVAFPIPRFCSACPGLARQRPSPSACPGQLSGADIHRGCGRIVGSMPIIGTFRYRPHSWRAYGTPAVLRDVKDYHVVHDNSWKKMLSGTVLRTRDFSVRRN